MPLRHLRHMPPRQYCDCGNSLQNRVNSITLYIIFNAKTGKIGLVTPCKRAKASSHTIGATELRTINHN